MKKTRSLKQNKNKKWKRRDVILLLERLELYISSGLTIDRALAVSSENIPKKQKAPLERVLRSVRSGEPLSRALSGSIRIPETIVGLIGHGESSGALPQALLSARALLEKEDELIRKCMSAMTYPIVIGIFALALTLGLMRGVMPQIVPMLKSLHAQLPFLTVAMIWLSDSLVAYGLYAAAASVALCSSLAFLYRRSQPMKSACQSFCARIPLAGSLVHDYSVAVFLRSCGSLVESGIPSAEAFKDTVSTIPLLPLRSLLSANADAVSRGLPVSKAVAHSRLPPYIQPLLSAGEASGMLGASMLRAASILDRDIDHSLKRLTSLIEPVMMAGMGTVVGAIAVSIMMPIYDISKVLQR